MLGCVVALAAQPAGAPAQAPRAEPPEQNRALLALIDQFLRDPLTYPALRKALSDSAYARKDIRMEISAKLLPWSCYDDGDDVHALDEFLTTAYLAGNLEAQLRAGRKRDRADAGLLGVLRVYPMLQAKRQNYMVPEVERWKAEAKRGRISRVADSLQNLTDPDCPTSRPARYRGKVTIRAVPDSAPSPQD